MYQNNRRSLPRVQKQKSPKWPFVLLAIFAACLLLSSAYMVFRNVRHVASDKDPASGQTSSFDKQQFSLTDPASPWVVVNKKRPLNPEEYEPTGLRTPNMKVESSDMQLNNETASSLEMLAAAASKDGVDLIVSSAYRSYTQQASIYNSMVRGYGQEQADRESARPGYSEHQSGWAVDLGAANGECRIEACFADTPEGKWLAANAYKHGFIIRYIPGKEQITGYNYEPWHLRYVGTELSTEMHHTGTKTLEEFFGLPAAPSY